MFEHVIVALDGSAHSERALEYATFVAARAGARITLLRAFEGEETAARDYLERQAAAQRAKGIAAEPVAREGKAADVILSAAAERPNALIVMSTHGRGGLARLVYGSVASSVLTRARGPILLVPVRTNLLASGQQDFSHDIRIGAAVTGTDGELGSVHRLIVDARTNRVTDIVVSHGFALRTERVVPLEHVGRIDNGAVVLDLDADGFAGMNGFVEGHYRAPDPDYEAPPGLDHETFLLDVAVLTGSSAGFGQPVPILGFPGGEQTSPDNLTRPALAPGGAVLDVTEEKAGEIGELDVDPTTGKVTRLTMRHGFAGRTAVDIPITWIQELSDKGVVLNVPRPEIDRLMRGGS
jgi:nucleotide-binding universal stress UspA family protein/uncharacterized protein YrrD